MSEEQKQEEVKQEENQEAQQQDRPDKNYEAELARKDAMVAELRARLAEQKQAPKLRDPNDMSTWGDHELKAVLRNQDPQYAHIREQAEDILMDRRVESKIAKQQETNKRVSAEMRLRTEYPDALNPTSELAVKMDKILHENDLENTPAGRLVAAKLAAAEINQGKTSADARGRKMEQDRVNRVKSQMVDGDRSKPTNEAQNLEDKKKDLSSKLMSGNEKQQIEAISDILDNSGIRERFKKAWGE